MSFLDNHYIRNVICAVSLQALSLGVTQAGAQIAYTDLPDTRLTSANYRIDLNSDGINDILLYADIACTDDLMYCYNSVNVLSYDPVNINIITDLTTPLLHCDGAAAYNDGAAILPDPDYSASAYLASSYTQGPTAEAGTMMSPGTRSFGVIVWEFDGPHLAYVRVRSLTGQIAAFDVLDFGYSIQPYTSIIAGDTGALCYADFNQDGGIDGSDIEAFFIMFASGEPGGDVNQDGGVDGADIETFFIAWMAGTC